MPQLLYHGTHCIGGWVHPKASLNAVGKRKTSRLCQESKPGCPTYSPTLSKCIYPGSTYAIINWGWYDTGRSMSPNRNQGTLHCYLPQHVLFNMFSKNTSFAPVLNFQSFHTTWLDRLCGLVVRVLDYWCRGPGFDSRALQKKSSGSGTGSTQPREYN
jgi:hypothetical protein